MPVRDEHGRFVKGHSGNPKGRAPRSTEEKYLKAIRSTVKIQDWKRIVQTAIARAQAGDNVARQWLSDYLLGKPTQRVQVQQTGDMTIGLQWDDGDDNDKTAIPPPGATGDPPEQGEIQSGGSGQEVREDQAGSD